MLFFSNTFIDISASIIAITFVIGFILYLIGYRRTVNTAASSADSTPVRTPARVRIVEANDEQPGGLLRRRHSTGGPGPFQFAKVAKDFIRNRGRYRRQFSEVLRESLPKPPSEYFEPLELPEIPQNLRPEFFYLRHNIKVLELQSDWPTETSEIDVQDYNVNDFIAKVGDIDDSMYVVLDGTVNMYINHEGKEYLVRRLDKGQTFFSYLSLIDILMNKPSVFRSVSLQASSSCRVAKYCLSHFYQEYQDSNEQWCRPIQIIMTRLLHVTMTTLHQYLGLGEELIKKRMDERVFDEKQRNFSVHSMRITAGRLRPRQRRLSSSDAKNEFISTATKWYSEVLGLTQVDGQKYLNEAIQILSYDEDQLLVEQGSTDDPCLYLVLHGYLSLSQTADPDDEDDLFDSWSAFIYPKEIVGGLQLLSNEPAFYQVKAETATTVAMIKKSDIEKLVESKPKVVLYLAYTVLKRLSPFLRAIDFAIDWVLLDSGQAVYRQSDAADSLFVVLSGRMRSVDKMTAIAEYGRGDVLGMVEVIQRRPRTTTVLAVRFSQLARVPDGLLNFIKMRYPQVGFRLVRLLGQSYNDTRRTEMLPPSFSMENVAADSMAQIKNLHTVAILPASFDVPIMSFTCELYHAMSSTMRVLRLSAKKVAEHLGETCLDKLADFRLMHWLNAQEDTFPLVIYECDYTATNWTRRCLRQADTILVVGRGDKKPQRQTFLEEHIKMNQDGIRTRKELILLWSDNETVPTNTYEWLKGSWFSGHYHVRAPERMFKFLDETCGQTDEHVIVSFYEKEVFRTITNCNNDFARLGRILTGNAVGLVLGGGGARGAAHVGIIEALRECNVPIDIVGGTSIGSFIGGIFAENPSGDITIRAKTWFMMMSSLWRKIWDLTYAHTAMFTGAGFNKTVQDIFGIKTIEDLWIPYFCITTDITSSEMRVHRSGPLWMYSRASMSLAGYLPPLCDPNDHHLLLDGGYVNNVPADVMRSLGAKTVIAIDVGSASETDLYNYGDHLSGFWILWQRFNPWAQPIRVLGMEEIQSRLAYVSCVRQLELVKKAPYCHYLRPHIEEFKTLDFAKYDTIRAAGYEYGIEAVHEMIDKNLNIKALMTPSPRFAHLRHRQRETSRYRTSSFTDLAAQLSRIPSMKHNPDKDEYAHSFDAVEEWDDENLDEEIGFDENCEDCEHVAEAQSETPRLPSPVDTTNLEPSSIKKEEEETD